MYRSIYLSLSLSVCLSIYLQAWKRSYSARLPQFLHLTTSKTKQFCATSSFFEVDNIKNEAIRRDFFQKWKIECRADGLVPMRFAIFRLHLSKLLRLPRKSDTGSYEVLHLSRKISQNHLSKPEDLMLQNATLSGNQRPDLQTCLLYCACGGKCIFADPLRMFHTCHCFWKCYKTLTFCSLLTRSTIPLRLPRESTSERPKVVRTPGLFNILASKCASRHNGIHFFDIATSKSGPNMVCFVHFDFEVCFAPQRHAIFRHRNFQKWSKPGVLCTSWLRNVLRATTACNFSTSQLPKVVREWCLLYILTSKCASRHNGMQFFDIATSKSGPNMVCFVHFDFEVCFAPQRHALFRHRNFQKWSEHGVFCTFWLRNVLRATTACNFSTSHLPKVVRQWCALYILTSKCASRHNGVQFFISHLASWLRTRRFSEPTFRPSGATNHWKNTVFRDFATFSRTWIFFLLRLSLLWSSFFFSSLLFSSLTLPISSFHLSILSEVWLLNFLRSWWPHDLSVPCGFLKMGHPERLQPRRITFPEHDLDAWAQGDRRSAAQDLSVDKHVSRDLRDLAPEVEEFMSRALSRFVRFELIKLGWFGV